MPATDDDSDNDEAIHWPTAIMLVIGVLGALIVGLGNMSGCWMISP